MESSKEGTRFSGAEWASELRSMSLIGVGGIGSWLALNLGRIGHEIVIYDGDTIDMTNVTGGQMYRDMQVGIGKVDGVILNMQEYGCVNTNHPMRRFFDEEDIPELITITGLDNMAARKLAFERWLFAISEDPEQANQALFMDGRLTLEMMEIITVQGNDRDQIREYQEKYLFADSEVEELACTMKQSTFAAMGIACMMTATLCNWLTNKKMSNDMREVPFYQRLVLPMFNYKIQENDRSESQQEIAGPEVRLLPAEEPGVPA